MQSRNEAREMKKQAPSIKETKRYYRDAKKKRMTKETLKLGEKINYK